MKKISLLVTTIMVIVSCNCQKKAVEQDPSKALNNNQSLPVIEYVANTRGFYQKTTIENNAMYISKNRNETSKGEAHSISDIDIAELIDLYSKIDVENLPNFKDPTQARFYDGAAIANLKITLGDKVYESTAFDHGKPPVEIEKFVNKIVALGTKE
jgi:hypothetical protein